MRTFLTAIIIGILSISYVSICAQEGQEAGKILLKGIGGKDKWDSTNYILFTASGNDIKYFQNSRKFLINMKSGQARFEGRSNDGNNIVSLFNFKTGKLSKFFVNGNEVKQIDPETHELFTKINDQFKKDATFLFLPALIEQPETKTGKISSKIFNAEKLQSLPFQLKEGLSGEVLFNGETGLIKQFVDKEGQTYLVNGYKDIGGGLFLPTNFRNLENNSKSLLFSTVAAFTEMEETKFSIL
ncbi:hypothetical protein [Sphingobacterium corticibacterium]|uniref:Uncharacterized protein n=1 Tax=Sphingobacterium corticibacterium TaxID=2484746 RepID=A0A4Q6XPQ1_9SPHI|nr:hypothetical protein [Sphingobacterium corticibacterium]RZF58397.1 hypothetical protein EWE74_17450 [Sphingobacterium corticibacterium]